MHACACQVPVLHASRAHSPHVWLATNSLCRPHPSTHPPPTPPPQEELEALRSEQLEVEAAAAALEAELSANLRQQRRDLQDRLAAASSGVDAATLEARRRELAQVRRGLPGHRGLGPCAAPRGAQQR